MTTRSGATSEVLTITSISKWILATGVLLMLLAVILGAIGSHALESYFEKNEVVDAQKRLENWETAVRYQAYHGLGLLALGAVFRETSTTSLKATFFFILLGCVLFCGMLYGWVLLQNKIFVRIVPLGGMSFILGWIFALISVARLRRV